MKRASQLFLFIVAIALFQCGSPLPELPGVDLEQWKSDVNGCTGARLAMQKAIVDHKDKLLKLDELQITKLLGKPDVHELYKRNQKFYHYYLAGGPGCEIAQNKTIRLTIRFNAMGLAKEVAVQ